MKDQFGKQRCLANHFRLNNLVCIVDHNHMASLDFNENTIEIEDFGAKWSAFGWNVIEINGNDHKELKEAFRKASEFSSQEVHKPTVIIANTIKGCGVSFMQNDILCIIVFRMTDGNMIWLLPTP